MQEWWNFDVDESLLYRLYHVNSENRVDCTSVQIYRNEKKVQEEDCDFALSKFCIDEDSEFEKILHRRRTAKVFNSAKNISDEKILSKFCGLAFGKSIYNENFRTYPSGGALYPVDIYLLFNDKKCDMSRFNNNSVFKYNCDNKIKAISDAKWDEISKIIIANKLDSCQMIIILSTNFKRNPKKYKTIAYRLIQQEAGHIGQNILLTAEYLDFKAVPLGGYYEENAKKIIKSQDDCILYAILVG